MLKTRGTLAFVSMLCLLLCGGADPPARAGEANDEEPLERIELPELVVTANRLDTPPDKVGSSETVITREQLDRLQQVTVFEVLKNVPGLDLSRSGGPGSPASVFIRGANSGQTLVLIDGVEVNDPISTTRSFNFADLTTDNIERIEIVRGPQSTLYGSDAIGGVINIITRQGEGPPTLSLSLEGGSFNSWRGQLWSGGGGEKVNYSLGMSRQATEGISAAAESQGNTEKDGFENSTVSARVGFTPTGNFGINVIARYVDSTTDLDNFGGPWGDDPNHVGDQTQLVFRTEAELTLLDDLYHQKLGLSVTDIDREFRNDYDEAHSAERSESSFKGSIVKIDWQHNVHLGEDNTLTLGLETEEEKGDSHVYSESEYGPYSSVFEEQTARTNGYYIQDSIAVLDQWFTTAGIRLDDHDRFGSEVTWRLTSAWLVPDAGTTVRGSVGTGFKAPSLYQLFSEYGNVDLQPEKSLGWDVGLEQMFAGGRGSAGAAWFANSFDDLLDFDPVNYVYLNIAEAESRGLEIFATMQVGENIDLAGSYTFTDTEDRTTGEELLRRARHKGGINANYKFLERGNLNLDLLYIGSRKDNDFSTWPASVVELDPYFLATLAGSWTFGDHFQLLGRVENLLDEEYETVWGYGTPGIGGYLGLKFSL